MAAAPSAAPATTASAILNFAFITHSSLLVGLRHPIARRRQRDDEDSLWLGGARFKRVQRGGYFARLKFCSVGVPVMPVVVSVNFNSSPVIAIAIFCSP